nr:ABC transporter ATP-binding protein [uncultured Cohaesibacter sp.]
MIITFDNVVKRYKVRNSYKHILRGLKASFPERNIAIIGANGEGKSTLLRLIAGAELPDSGSIHRHKNISFPLGFAGSFNGSLTGIENTRFVARIYGQDTEAILDYVMKFSELGEHFYMPVRSYSSGMRARLAFGLSLAIDFECYLVDEITAVGDQNFQTKSKAAFKEKLNHANMIMVSHSPTTLKDYCDMGIILRNGNVIPFDNLDAALKDHDSYMRSL